MSDTNPTGTSDGLNADRVSASRRLVLQALATAAVGVTMLPAAWSKPIVGSIVVPAHAAVSPASPVVSVSQSNTPTPTSPGLSPTGGVTPTPTPSPSITPSISRSGGGRFRGDRRSGPLGIPR